MAGRDLIQTIECALSRYAPGCGADNAGCLNDAVRYALFPGGKRLRPILTILAARVFGEVDERVLKAACAVEFVHTSSLILDDLPCMDDANLRRGNPALHRVYGEDAALLAGIALLNQAYSLFGQTVELIREATECIGMNGMIGGQAIDLGGDLEDASMTERNRKTSALMRLAMTAGALALGASREQVAPLGAFGQSLGQAYQIYDDVLDAETPGQFTGKPMSQDLRHNRPSHATRSGPKACYLELAKLMDNARGSLVASLGPTAGVNALMEFVDDIFASAARPSSS